MNDTNDRHFGDDKCSTARRLLQSFHVDQPDDLNMFDNQKKLLLQICEYLLDIDMACDLFDNCLNTQAFMDCDVPQSLHNKRNLNFVMQYFDCVEPPFLDVENLPKVISAVIQIYCSDVQAEVVKTVPSLIGIVGMISLFYMFADGHIQKNDLSRQLEILLPSSSEQPFVAPSRKYCLTAVDALQNAQPKNSGHDTKSYLESIESVQYLLSRYPLTQTIDHIKQLLYTYKEQATPSTLKNVYYTYLDGKVIAKNYEWPSTDFVTIREIQQSMELTQNTFQQIVLGEDQKVREFLQHSQPQVLQPSSLPPQTQTQSHRLNTTITTQEHPTAQVHSQVHVKNEKEEKPKPKRRASNRIPTETHPPRSVQDTDEHHPVKKKKRRFSEEETQNLIEGVKKFGVGRWKNILNNYKFDGRSCVDLKDKWRNLEFSRMRNTNKQKSAAQQPERSNGAILPSVNSDKMYPTQQKPHDYITPLMGDTMDYNR
ncbi:Myb family DNA-binding domain containing protein [Entamoeba marina]